MSGEGTVLTLRPGVVGTFILDVHIPSFVGVLRATVDRTAEHECTIRLISRDHQAASGTAHAEQVHKAVNWLVEVSWTLRARLEKGLATDVVVPLQLSNTPSRYVGMPVPRPGVLVRPLICEFSEINALRPFQREGATWLGSRSKAILADDMGLGKTLQVIAATRKLMYEGSLRQVIVVCPKTLVSTWADEINKWAPELTVALSTYWNGSPSDYWREMWLRTHYLVCHYEFLKGVDEDLFAGRPVDLLVLDEAHRVRKSDSQANRTIHRVAAGRIWALSGTPLERDVEDFATLVSIVDPLRFAPDLAEHGEAAVRSVAKTYTLRRKKEDVLQQLPQVQEQVHRVSLTWEQRKTYEQILRALPQHKDKAAALTSLQRLLEVCDADPDTGISAKLDAAEEIIDTAWQGGEKSIVFSHRLEPLRELARRLLAHGVKFQELSGELSSEQRGIAVKKFRGERDQAALLASLKVGAEGLTLTEANHVIFINRWWNPSANNQARDRVVRIGQERTVFVHYLVCEDTVEERLSEILVQKEGLFSETVDQLSKRDNTGADESILLELLRLLD